MGNLIENYERESDRSFPKYSISVVVLLTGVPPHTLRQYEQAELLRPSRTEGNTRRYSDADVEIIREIARLAGLGINYAGIREVLRLRRQWHEMRTWPGDSEHEDHRR